MLTKLNLNYISILKKSHYKFNLWCAYSTYLKASKRPKSNQNEPKGFVVWAPDIPSDTPASNLLLSLPQDDSQLTLSSITPQNCLRAFIQNIIHYDSYIEDFNSQGIFKSVSPRDFFCGIESKFFPLEYCISVISLLNSIKPKIYNDDIMRDFRRTFNQYQNIRFQNLAMYNFIRETSNDLQKLHNADKLILSSYLLKCKLNGAHLFGPKKEKLNEINKQIEQLKKEFNENVLKSSAEFTLQIHDTKVINSLPDDLLLMTGDNLSVRITLHNHVQSRFMEFCPNQSLRYQIWCAFNNRASILHDIKTSNSITLDTLRALRKDVANLLGYDTYAHYCLVTKIPGTVESIKDSLNLLHSKTRPIFEKDMKELKAFAKENNLIETSELQPWDIDFLRRRILKTKYKHKIDVMQYFTIDSVLKGLFNLCQKLFNIEIEQVAKNSFDSWNESVQLFRIYSENKFLGSFYLDPFQHNLSRKLDLQTPQVIEITKKSEQFKTKPISVLLFNAKPMLHNQVLQLQMFQVVELFKAFGRILQLTLSEVPYSELSGIYNLEKDHLDWISGFLGLWPIYNFQTSQSCSSHIDTGEPLPLENFQALQQASNKFSSLNLTYEIFKSSLDLALNSNKEFWLDITHALWKMYMSPFEIKKDYHYPCSWMEAITGDYTSIYFTQLWTQVIAMDTFKVFYDAKEEDISQLGLKLKNDVIVNGGAIPARELFRKFRQRDPSIDAFLELSNLV